MACRSKEIGELPFHSGSGAFAGKCEIVCSSTKCHLHKKMWATWTEFRSCKRGMECRSRGMLQSLTCLSPHVNVFTNIIESMHLLPRCENPWFQRSFCWLTCSPWYSIRTFGIMLSSVTGTTEGVAPVEATVAPVEANELQAPHNTTTTINHNRSSHLPCLMSVIVSKGIANWTFLSFSAAKQKWRLVK